MRTIDDVLLPVFSRQHWLVTDNDIRAAGGSRGMISRRLTSGRWELADQRVYHLKGAPFTWRSSLLAPILSAGPGAVASHFAAAALHGIPGYGEGTPELTIPRGRERRRPQLLVHTSTDLDRCGTRHIDSIPVTDVERTLLDIGRRISDKRLSHSIEAARRAGLTGWDELITTLVAHARRGRPGIARLRRVIAQHAHRAEVTDSNLELMIIALLLEHGLPEPVLHHRVYDADRFVAEVDLAYPIHRIAIEVDGRVHLDDAVRERDLPRQNDLILSGWIVLRFTWARLRDRPESIVAEVRAAIRARS
ncbi:MAG: endonuclease domain-containing protein [Acidimicrobiales bacterium]